MEPRWTVYSHTHVASGRRYVGLTKKTMLARWNQHVANAKAKRGKGCAHFWAAIRLYGKDAFSHEVLEVCETVDLANAAEERWIEKLCTRDPAKGFNLAKGGQHVPHPIKNPWDRPGFREKATAYLKAHNDSLTSEDRSARTKKLWEDPAFRQKVEPHIRAMATDPSVRLKAVSAMKATKARPGVKARASEVSRRMWEDPFFRQANAAMWSDPVFREKCESGLRAGATINAAKTHCKHGHEFTTENTRLNRRGSRECRTCLRIQKLEGYYRRKPRPGARPSAR